MLSLYTSIYSFLENSKISPILATSLNYPKFGDDEIGDIPDSTFEIPEFDIGKPLR